LPQYKTLQTTDRQTDRQQTTHCTKGSTDSTVGQKGLKSVYIYQSYYKNKSGGPFFGTPCTCYSIYAVARKNLQLIKWHMFVGVTKQKVDKDKLSGINVRTEYLRQFTCMHACSKTRVILNTGQVRLNQSPLTCRL